MIIKFFVVFFYINSVLLSGHSSLYCKICVNHTLCKYTSLFPNNTCIGYDKTALLNEEDVTHILHRLNEKRNFIALHRSKYFPGAANMRKIEWSIDLAFIAQRWADQCDTSIRPDKNDQCRDLENMAVGQNIATITGLSPGINIQSFVDTWFMESLEYNGNVSYYNQSRDFKVNSFLQLIWAETDQVGCGKVRFYVKRHKAILVHRLVCNFAPKGNIHGKPVYNIGYPATQCLEGMVPDERFTGLCTNKYSKTDETSLETLPVTSPLRIRNLSDSVAKFEIDPVQQNSKLAKSNINDSSYAAIKRSHPLQNENFWNDNTNLSRNYNDHNMQHERGHSRVYHGHNHKNEFDSIHPETVKDWRRYDVVTSSTDSHISKDYRKHYVDDKCTRTQGFQPITPENSCESAPGNLCGHTPGNSCSQPPQFECGQCKENVKRCTRGQTSYCESATKPCPVEICPCNTQKPKCYTKKPCNLHNNCNNVVTSCYATRCPHMRRNNAEFPNRNQMQNPSDSQNYDQIPDLGLRKVGVNREGVPGHEHNPTEANLWVQGKVKHKYDPYTGRNRKRRYSEDEINFKPFWQVDEFTNKKQPSIKSIRYTTLPNKKFKKSKKTTKTTMIPKITEFITIREQKLSQKKGLTEKYLSFDELMHLRKYSIRDFNARRQGDTEDFLRNQGGDVTSTAVTTLSTISTSEYTANTPFVRMRHCTRKLTCTWTAASLTDSSGNVIGGAGGGGARGSNTPPGYVEGCTRTSTCTRDFMNRNKMDTLPTESTINETDIIVEGDEDYCERRSLNRRNLDKIVSIIPVDIKTGFKNMPSEQKTNVSKHILEKVSKILNFKHNRSRREAKLYPSATIRREKRSQDYSSYGDLYYYIIRKIIKSWKSNKKLNVNNQCMCNCSLKIKNCFNLLICVITYHIFDKFQYNKI